MPNRTRQVGLYAFSLHGRADTGVIDYQAFVTALAAVPPIDRQTGVGDETVAVTLLEPSGPGRWTARFVTGLQGLPPLFYDPATGTESTADLGNRFVASASWAFIDTSSRIVLIDRSRPGVAVNVMARALSHLGRELGIEEGLVVSLNPVPSPGFLEELERYDRIRQASVVLTRPNYDWTDSSTQLSGYADLSNAGTVDVLLSAGRGQSLSMDEGIVPDIKRLATRAVGPLKNLRITGKRRGETKETSVSLAKHQEKRFTPLPADADALAVRDTLARVADELFTEVSLGQLEK